jgi:DNA repair protein RadC
VGVGNLSLDELLALIVGSGSSGASLEAITRGVSEAARGSLARLARMDAALLESVPGIGVAGACRLLAALELGRRAATEDVRPGTLVRGPSDVFRLMGPRLRDLRQEEFHAVLLDTRHRLITDVLVTRGILDASLIHPREVFRSAISEDAAGVIVVHNHPSGDPAPSAEDRAVTKQLAAAGRALSIPLLDHVIVGRGRFVSLGRELKGHTWQESVGAAHPNRKHMKSI